jgi:hypothetical protein
VEKFYVLGFGFEFFTFCFRFKRLPGGVIGNTEVFGTSIPGSSPGRVVGRRPTEQVNSRTGEQEIMVSSPAVNCSKDIWKSDKWRNELR